MPNKRDADKKLIAAWVPADLKRRIEDAAAKRGQNVSQFVEEQIEKAVQAQEVSKKKTPKSQ